MGETAYQWFLLTDEKIICSWCEKESKDGKEGYYCKSQDKFWCRDCFINTMKYDCKNPRIEFEHTDHCVKIKKFEEGKNV